VVFCTWYANNIMWCRYQWPLVLSPGSGPARLLGLWVWIPPGTWMCISCYCCVVSGRGLCDGLITHPEESYLVWCAWVWFDVSIMRGPWTNGGPGPMGPWTNGGPGPMGTLDQWGPWTNGGPGPMGPWTNGGPGPMGALDQWGLLRHVKKRNKIVWRV